jgi:hypothetical protein
MFFAAQLRAAVLRAPILCRAAVSCARGGRGR